jgi:hypothetical protein
MFAPELLKPFPGGGAILDEEALYVGNKNWTFRVFNPQNHFPTGTLDILAALRESGEVADCRLLHATEIDILNETFLPIGERKHISMRQDRYYIGSNGGTIPRRSFELQALFDDRGFDRDPRVDLMKSLEDGLLRTRYPDYEPTPVGTDPAGSIRRERPDTASLYADEEIMVAYKTRQIAALYEMGFSLFFSTQLTGKPPVAGGWNEAMQAEVLLSACRTAGKHPLRPGEETSTPHYMLCWYSVQQGIASLSHNAWSFRPGTLARDGLPGVPVEDFPEALLEQGKLPGIEMLRWRGVSEKEILRHLREAQSICTERLHTEALASAERLYKSICAGGDRWAEKRWGRDLQDLCGEMEWLKESLGDIDLGHLPKAVEAFKEYECVSE